LSVNYLIPDVLPTGIAGGDERYAAKNVAQEKNHKLKGKTIYWLGSSVTYGSAAGGESMADYLAAKTGCISKKEAVSGTTLFDDGATANTGAKSYVRRLQNSTVFDERGDAVDAFICQISTNDCTNERLDKRGKMSEADNFDRSSFDVATSLGAVEFIISYVSEHFDCPIYFYSGAYFGDGSDKAARQNSNPKGNEYAKFVKEVKEIAEKWDAQKGIDVGVIDLNGDALFNQAASDEYYAWAMNDPIHPKKAGYLQWWTPYFEAYLSKAL
ncbi:MAG: SGNH/GDSL hydrolase family protein, partial [Bacilli bacterium]|nr:SGNH/GDSL hydrolase family protein [Bacilli bacterium]